MHRPLPELEAQAPLLETEVTSGGKGLPGYGTESQEHSSKDEFPIRE